MTTLLRAESALTAAQQDLRDRIVAEALLTDRPVRRIVEDHRRTADPADLAAVVASLRTLASTSRIG